MLKRGTAVKICVLIVVFCIVVFSQVSAKEMDQDDGLTLIECMRMGLENNFDVVLARIDLEENITYMERAQRVGDEDLIENATNMLDGAKDNMINTRRNVAEQIRNSFYAILRAEDALAGQKQALSRSEITLQADELRYEAGEISKMDIDNRRSSFINSQETYERSIRDLKTQYMEFNNLLGRELHEELSLAKDYEFDLVEVEFGSAHEAALENRDDIKNARQALDEAIENVEKLDNPFTALVDFEKAKTDVIREEIKLEKVRRSIYFTIRSTCFSMEQAIDNIYNAEEELSQALRDTEAKRLQYEAGVISTQQMIDAENELAAKENNIVHAKWDYNNAKLNYLQAIGISGIDRYIEEALGKEEAGLLYLKQESGNGE